MIQMKKHIFKSLLCEVTLQLCLFSLFPTLMYIYIYIYVFFLAYPFSISYSRYWQMQIYNYLP